MMQWGHVLVGTLLLCWLVDCDVVSVGCGIATKDGIYNLRDLGRTLGPPWSVDISNGETIEFGICDSEIPCYSRYAYTWGKLVANGSCVESITRDGDPVFSRQTVNETANLTAVAINYTSLGLKCRGTNDTYKFVVYVACDPKVHKDRAKPVLYREDSEKCNYEILLSVDRGCPLVNWGAFWEFTRYCWPIVSLVLLASGVLTGVFGHSMWRTITLVLFALTFVALYTAFSYEVLLPFDAATWLVGLVLFMSLALGVASAHFAAKYQTAGFVLLGAWLGASFTVIFEDFIHRALVCAFLMYKIWRNQLLKGAIITAGLLFIPLIYTLYVNEITFWISFVSTTALCGVIAYSVEDLLVIIATSFIGAYLSVRGLSFFVGRFPSEALMYTQISEGNLEYTWELRVYATLILALAVVFVFVQEHLEKRRKEQEEKEGEHTEEFRILGAGDGKVAI